MSYPQELLSNSVVRTSSNFDTAEVLTAAAAVYGSYVVHYPISLTRFTFSVSTTISDLTASVIRLTKVSIANVTTALTSMTIPNGTAARKVVYKDFTPVVVESGELLQMEHLTQGGLGGTPAGAGFYGFIAHFEPEVPGNLANMIASA